MMYKNSYSLLRKNCIKIFSILLLFSVAFFVFQTRNIHSQSSQEIILKTKYEQTKQNLEARLREAQVRQNQALDEINISQEKQLQLSDEIREREAEIALIDSQIEEIKIILEEIRQQKIVLEDRIQKAENDLGEVVIEIQNESRIPVVEKLFGSTIADGLKRMYYLNTLNEEAQALILKIEQDQAELEENEKAQEATKEELESSQALAESKKSSLEVLLEITKGEQEEYENLLNQAREAEANTENELEQQNTAYNIQLEGIRAEEARLAAIRAEQERARQNTGTSIGGVIRNNRTATGSLCYFETTPPVVPSGFFQMPSSGYISNPIQCTSSYSHDGLDIAAAMGTPIYSIGDGTVARVGPAVTCIGISCNGGFGNYIVVKHTLPSGKNLYSLYAHLRYGPNLSVGQSVAKGQQVGQMGCTGNTRPFPCGVHLHFMIIDGSIANGISCIYNNVSCINPLTVIG